MQEGVMEGNAPDARIALSLALMLEKRHIGGQRPTRDVSEAFLIQ